MLEFSQGKSPTHTRTQLKFIHGAEHAEQLAQILDKTKENSPIAAHNLTAPCSASSHNDFLASTSHPSAASSQKTL